jgi:cobalt-zinc-cadmium efflux system outer membrane protein
MKKILFFLLIGYGVLRAQAVISLEQAMQQALQSNPELQQARQERRAAAGRFWSGISLPQPELSYAYEYMPRGKSLNSFGERTLELAQEVEFPATYLLRGRLLQNETGIAAAAYRSKALGVIAEVQRWYWEVKAREAQLAIAHFNLALAEEFSRKAAIRHQAGEGSWLEKMTAEVQRTQAQNSVESARNDRSSALIRLFLLLGRRGEAPNNCVLTDTLTFQPRALSLAELEQATLRRNPEVDLAERLVRTLRNKKALSFTSLLPGFKLAWSQQALEGGRNDYYGVAFGASLPLWFLFDQRGRIQEAAADLRSGEYEQMAIHNAVLSRLRTAWLDYANQERQVRLYQAELLPQAEEVYRTATVSYDAGEIGYLELLQSRQTLAAVKGGYIEALLGYHQAAIQLTELAGEVPDGINLNEE